MATREEEQEALKKREAEVFMSERREDYGALIIAAITIVVILAIGLKTGKEIFSVKSGWFIFVKSLLPLL
jgi:hypothetical protein